MDEIEWWNRAVSHRERLSAARDEAEGCARRIENIES